ncbi:MAG: hypothetical protein KC416_15745, partial [Myxococcales bacterium]|nr:hypothetical protein [Myxococcales bacterium]
SRRVYARPLALSEILESWKGRKVSTSNFAEVDADHEEAALEAEGEMPATSPFGAMSLYDMYRAFHDLGARLRLQSQSGDERAMRSALEGSPDSIFSICVLVNEDNKAASSIRYLLLREAAFLMDEYAAICPPGPRAEVHEWLVAAKAALLHDLAQDLKKYESRANPTAVFAWFERELQEAWVTP